MARERASTSTHARSRIRLPKWSTTTKRTRRIFAWSSVGLAVLLVLLGSLVYTEQSHFCPICHEMSPYYDAWSTGAHSAHASCVDCHVDAGILAHLAHKPIALKEVWDHFFANSKFPNFTVDVPNSRCERCHPTVADTPGSLFKHSLHATKATCKDCHTQTGHLVTLASLDAAGVPKNNAAVPVPGGLTPSSIPGHKKVICQDCHDQAAMKCSACHQPPHDDRGDCTNCHVPGDSFAFKHAASLDCAGCHIPPANHFGPDCSACHTSFTVPFKQTVFTHPQVHHGYQSRPCAKCHPNGYATSYCTCHNGNPPGD